MSTVRVFFIGGKMANRNISFPAGGASPPVAYFVPHARQPVGAIRINNWDLVNVNPVRTPPPPKVDVYHLKEMWDATNKRTVLVYDLMGAKR